MATLINRVFRIPSTSGLVFKIVASRDTMTSMSLFASVRVVEQLAAVGRGVGWDMDVRLYAFTRFFRIKYGKPRRCQLVVTTARMTSALLSECAESGVTQVFFLFSFKSGGALTRALAEDSLPSISKNLSSNFRRWHGDTRD